MGYGRRSVPLLQQLQATHVAVLYARVSTKEQELEGYSIDAQLGLLRRYAAEHGIQIAAEFIEAETAKQTGRKQFQQMLTFIKAKRIQAILCEKVDRLYRNLSDRVRVGELDLELHFVKENTVLTKDSKSHEKFVHDIKLVVAKNYVDNLSEEARKGMEEKARQGIWPSVAPFGYRNALKGSKRVIEQDPGVAPKIRRLFEVYGEGAASLDGVKDLARTLGLRTRKGNALYKSNIAQILSNPIYCGLIQWNGIVYEGTHEPVVSLELWHRVQEIMKTRNRNNTGFGVLDFTYKGLFTCAHCGCAVTAELKKGKYIYYHCTGRRGKCAGQRCIEEKTMTAQISAFLSRIRIEPEVLGMLRESLKESFAEERSFHDEQRTSLEAECKKLEAQLETLYLDKISGQVPISVFEKYKPKWEAELAQAKVLLESLGKAQSSYFELGVSLLELGSNCHSRFEQANPKGKRDLLKSLCSNCTLKDGSVQLSLQEPFKSMLEICESEADSRDIGIWLPAMDSNHDKQIQRLLSCH